MQLTNFGTKTCLLVEFEHDRLSRSGLIRHGGCCRR